MRLTALILLAAAATACHAQRPLGVHEAIKQVHVLNGKTVRVVGYLGKCAGYDCQLFENEQEGRTADHWFAAIKAHRQPEPIPAELEQPPPDGLGIGTGKLVCPTPNATSGCYYEFDRKAAPFNNSYVLITGRITNQCRDEQGRPGCTDRGTDLEPISIARWTPAPGNAS